ncbi:GNAT family N-acetyltransferase [Flavobacterium luteum]|uniref:GNAT family N-acetyltransferase n=1 Tax=Flavobacterium luteum TaxID=2026654 RepID=A0A7J5AEH7_9FLAO|nr:GNAT family N-acetyltransferase [Flavobacterium luteum]KAB1155838.1 GNAT family N-acetyltransferase [Flavobacterium luteum]
MTIKTSEVNDISAIVDLLKLSLGESVVEKTANIWNFKHVDNPFGHSQVLVALENEAFIGVRAFMKWNWQLGNHVWTAYRAVDTATHPDFQGKGIFKRLTLKALDDVQENQETFVFNTPNDKSRPGYLKMGWVIVDALPITIVPTIGYFFQNIFKKMIVNTNKIEDKRLQELCEIHNKVLSENNVIFTPKSASYLRWRFENNPMQKYKVVSSNDFYVAMYVKKRRLFKELRIVEVISTNQNLVENEIRSVIVNYAFQNRCWIMTLANKNLFYFRLHGKFGPKFTFKALTKNDSFINKALNIYNWKYSLGDLELF